MPAAARVRVRVGTVPAWCPIPPPRRTVLDEDDVIDLRLGDCLVEMPKLAANSIDLICVDPPYYKVKNESWDEQWDTPAKFLEWIGALCKEWERILKPNGSLYVFASPRMSARVECKLGETFNILNTIRWVKEAGWHNKTEKEALRQFLSPYEHIIFAEHCGADSIAKGEAGYAAKCDQLRGFIFEPLRKYLDDEIKRAGVTPDDINEALGFRRQGGMAGRHYFSRSQWCLPTAEHYQKMRVALSNLNHRGEYLRRDYEDLRRDYEDLRRDYEDLRRDYEDLRRPFAVAADVPYTDVWNFPTVAYYPGKHPCEKPLAMIEHIVRTSSKVGAVVLDCFMGSGVTGQAAQNLRRDFIGMENHEPYFIQARQRLTPIQPALAAV